MQCFMCFASDGRLQMIQSDMDNATFKSIKFILPDFLIPESMNVFICSTCLEQVSFFHSIKKGSLQNCSRLKYFNAMLKKENNVKYNELEVILNSVEKSVQRKHHIEFKVNPKSKNVLSLGEQDASLIKEEDNEDYDCSQQLVNDEACLNHSPENASSCSSDDSTQHHVNVGSFEFVDTNKFTEEDSNLTSKHSGHKNQLKTHESEKKKFKCTDCHKTFTRRSSLQQHIRVHTGDKPYKCTTCKKTFTLLGHLKVHKLTHTGEKPYKCKTCQKTFTQLANLQKHKLTHTGEKPYKCRTCQKTFTQLANLNRHKLTHTSEKPHECNVCHKTFSQKSTLISHKRIHSNVRPYKCAVCSKAFTQSGVLNRHMRSHTGEKPHQCHLCEYKCVDGSALKRHIRCHTGEKLYSCKHCEKSFTTSSNLKEHKRRVHRNDTD